MKVIDPGHLYSLDSIDGQAVQTLMFVKREGENYPGNMSSYPGTTIQEVLRVLIDRCWYVNAQIACAETEAVQHLLESAVLLLESRAAQRHKRISPSCAYLKDIPNLPVCPGCGHVNCDNHCGRVRSVNG